MMKKDRKKILVINGPNLNLLGIREKTVYGSHSLESINKGLEKLAGENGVAIEFFQSNHEGAIVDRIQQARESVDVLIINPAAYTHTSVAIRDAILAVQLPAIEIHLSNIFSREEFRHHSYISGIAKGVISGFGAQSYKLAFLAALEIIKESK